MLISGDQIRRQALESDDHRRLRAAVLREKRQGDDLEQQSAIRMSEALTRMMETDGWKIVETMITRMIDTTALLDENEERRNRAMQRGQVARELLRGIYAYQQVGADLKAAQEEQKAAKEGE